jgi:hypothetical protein
MEQTAEKPVSERDRTQPISVSEAETLSRNLHHTRLHKLHHSQFLKISVRPHVVVTLEEIHLHPPVHKLLKCSENPDIPLRHHILILIPEIPDITEKIDSLRLLRKRTQEIRKATLTGFRIEDLEAEMHV